MTLGLTSSAVDAMALTPATDAAVVARDLTRSFDGKPALVGLNIDAHPGEVLAVLGPNGAGKTTTVRLLNGVLRADRGESRVCGFDPQVDGDSVRRCTGVLTENAGLDDRLTAFENLDAVARIRGFGATESARRIDAQLERFGMIDMRDRQTVGFSTGQRKRLALARALLHDPEVLFLDEPTSGLDPTATREVTDLIGSLARERGRTIVLCTHFLGEAGRIADRMAVLDHGRLRAIGRPDELAAELWHGISAEVELAQPATADVLALIDQVPGVTDVMTSATGASFVVGNRTTMSVVFDALARAHVEVLGGGAHPASIEDIYFAVERRIAEQRVT